jgi:hypothetical protein
LSPRLESKTSSSLNRTPAAPTARPADPLEIWEFHNCYIVDETRFQPAIVVEQCHRNGYRMLTRILVGAPKGINLYNVSEELVRRIFDFEPARH